MTPDLLAGLSELLADLEALYVDLHAHPELSMQEVRTAGRAQQWLERSGFDVTTGVGGTGVVGVLRNGSGPTVMLRADMDALPVREATGLPYASTVAAPGPDGKETPVAHACGHDMHVTWLAGVTALLARNRAAWRGTVLAIFQPAEETGAGALRMVDDMTGRFPKPDVILAQHVAPSPAGLVTTRPGPVMAASDVLRVRMFGRGGHGSMPSQTVDPVLMAAATVQRLHAIVSREVSATDSAVLTVGTLHAGTKENVIPDEATLGINVRSFDEAVRLRVLDAIRRVVEAEAQASGAPRPPEITPVESYLMTDNDPDATARVLAALTGRLGADQVRDMPPAPGSEDVGAFGRAWKVPSVMWFVGGSDPQDYRAAAEAGRLHERPSNHSAAFAPIPHPTIERGVEIMLTAAGCWLA